MKRQQQPTIAPKDTPATRKRRLQQRLQEITASSEKELAKLAQTIEQVKARFTSKS